MKTTKLDFKNCVIVEFPLRGEWSAGHSPANRIPSHGTDQFAQTYAFDFVRIDNQKRYYSKSLWHHLIGKVLVEDCYSWSQPVFAPFDGEIIDAGDGSSDRKNLNYIKDIVITSGLFFLPKIIRYGSLEKFIRSNLLQIFGNYIMIQGEEAIALFAHLRCGSLKISIGQHIVAGEMIAEVGHSGNSTAPHLHFQLIDTPDIFTAKGILCCFRSYERWNKTSWETVQNDIPKEWERIRVITK